MPRGGCQAQKAPRPPFNAASTAINPAPRDHLIIQPPRAVQKIDSIPVKVHQSIRPLTAFSAIAAVPSPHRNARGWARFYLLSLSDRVLLAFGDRPRA